MKYLPTFIILVLFLGCAGVMFDSESTIVRSDKSRALLNEIKTVSVLPFRGANGNLVSEIFSMELLDNLNWQLVERYQLEHIIKEHALSQTGLLDEVTGIKAGKILGVDALITGNVQMSVGWGSNEGVHMSLKLIHVETGAILWHASGESTWAGSINGNAKKASKEILTKFRKQL